jgi:hypothetical protein
MTDTILAVDLGRYKSVACAYARSTRQHTFRTIDTTPEDVGRLLARHPGAVVVIEACANPAQQPRGLGGLHTSKSEHAPQSAAADHMLPYSGR